MSEMNVEAERAAFAAVYIAEFGELKSIPREDAIELAWCTGMGRMWLAARRAAQPADVGAAMQELPTYYYDIDGSLRMKGREFEYGGTGEYVRAQDVREAIAADLERQKARIMHLTYERDKARDDLRAQLARQSQDGERYRLVRAQLSRSEFNYLMLEGEPESDLDEYCDSKLQAAVAAPPLSSEPPAEKGADACGS